MDTQKSIRIDPPGTSNQSNLQTLFKFRGTIRKK